MSSMDALDLAPIALFVFKRPGHTLQTLNSLTSNPEFAHSPLYIYCDGARNSNELRDVELTRRVVNDWTHPNKKIITQEKNRGLANSVIAGVSELTEQFGRVIVVEDDLIVSANFLNYLNSALDKYKDEPHVMQISGYMFPVHEYAERREALFLPNISSWGWATWRHAWKFFDANARDWKMLLNSQKLRNEFDVGGSYGYSDMLLRQMNGDIDSWAIRWNWSVFRNKGLVLYPPASLVRNIGFDGSGTHCSVDDFHNEQVSTSLNAIEFSRNILTVWEDVILVRRELLKMSGTPFVRLLKSIRNEIRRVQIKIFGIASNKKLEAINIRESL